jgi:hypothetical protein
MALGAEAGMLPINVTTATDLSSFLRPSDNAKTWGLPARIQRTEEVVVARLDDILADCVRGLEAPRVFLKMDTQGFDAQVLQGAKRSVDFIVGIQTELAIRPLYDGMMLFPDNLRPFLALGYEMAGLFAVSREPDGIAAIECDCTLRRVGGAARA